MSQKGTLYECDMCGMEFVVKGGSASVILRKGWSSDDDCYHTLKDLTDAEYTLCQKCYRKIDKSLRKLMSV